MTANTKIEWAHHTFNPWYGCQKVGPGCDNCYAEGWAKRSGLVQWGPDAERRRSSPAYWRQPLRWNAEAKRRSVRYRVFCASLADVFDNQVPAEWRADLFAQIEATPHLDWLLVTKRIGNVSPMVRWEWLAEMWPANVWLGITVVNQEEADRDIPKLLETPAAVRFLSMEPLIGEVNLTRLGADKPYYIDALRGVMRSTAPISIDPSPPEETGRIDWVIVGGESAHHARPMHPDWARSLRDQCKIAGVPFLFKQWGEWVEIDGPKTVGGPVSRLERGPHVAYVMRDGEVVGPEHRMWKHKWAWGDYLMARVGKKVAGRLLDGVQHDGYPHPALEVCP